MRLFVLLILFSFSLQAENQPSKAKVDEMSRLKLVMAFNLAAKTKIGQALKPYIYELLQNDKIRLTDLQAGHYGESGEGCMVKNGEYQYEGLYMLVNQSLNVEEIASSLVHEAAHYRMLKTLVELNYNFPLRVVDFEISAFATQYEFITELEQLKLVNAQSMFAGEANAIIDIMRNAYKNRNNWSAEDYAGIFKQLADYGYPESELNRVLSLRAEKDCVGKVE